MESGSESRGVSGINRDEWLKAMQDAGLSNEDDQDAVTVTEFAEMFDLHRATAERHLAKLESAGKAIRTRKRSAGIDGRRYSAVAYRLEK